MGNGAAIAGVVLLMIGLVLIALRGGSRSKSWVPYIGVALAVLGVGIELVGAVSVA